MAESIKSALKLHPHPARGFYSEIYRDNSILTKAQTDVQWLVEQRACSSHIYFLLVGADFDKLHRVRCDEGFSYYAGNTAVLVHCINSNGSLTTKTLDPKTFSYYANVSKGTWFGVELADKKADSYALVGLTVAPAFEFAEFELADRQTLAKQFPQHIDLINKFT